MGKKRTKLIKWGIPMLLSTIFLTNHTENNAVEASKNVSHIGTFNGSTTFMTSSSNGINPGLFIEVMDDNGNSTQYESEDGMITISNTKEGAYITQAKLLGKTKYRDLDTNELLDEWEEGRNLELASVENPKLKTVGKNLFDMNSVAEDLNNISKKIVVNSDGSWTITSSNLYLYKYEYRPIIFKEGIQYTLSGTITNSLSGKVGTVIRFMHTDGTSSNFNTTGEAGTTNYTSSTSIEGNTINYLRFAYSNVNQKEVFSNIQLEEGAVATPYEPYKENVITPAEEIELRGIGAVRDELDLMTGKVTERIGEVVLDGSDNEGWGVAQTYNDGIIYQKELSAKSKYGLCNNFLFNENLWWEGSGSGMQFNGSLTHIQVKQPLSFNDFISYLNANPLVIQHELPKESVKAIDLTNTYTFPPILNKNISIKGNITTTLGSITVPTEALSFTLNPNLEAGQQFIAPEFTISNESQAPIKLELKSFEQTTNILNDVLPSKYTSWEGLNKEQSKDIALALEPQPSDSWATLNEGSYYVADISNVELGQIKGNSTVDFKFSALHGQSFSEILNPQYKLTFVFEL